MIRLMPGLMVNKGAAGLKAGGRNFFDLMPNKNAVVCMNIDFMG